MNVVFILFLLCSFLSVSFLYVGFYDAYVTSVQDNECHSIHEVESYVEVKLDFQRRHQTYKLYYSQTQTKPNPIKLKYRCNFVSKSRKIDFDFFLFIVVVDVLRRIPRIDIKSEETVYSKHPNTYVVRTRHGIMLVRKKKLKNFVF